MRFLFVVWSLIAAPLAAQSDPTWNFRTLDGEVFGSADLHHSKAIVLLWNGLDCPMSKVYLPRVGAIAKRYEISKTRFFVIQSNAHDSLERIKKQAETLPECVSVVHDRNGGLAKRFGVTRTTEAIVLDAVGSVRYRGAVDDQYGYRTDLDGGVGTYRKERASAHYLCSAIEALIYGHKVKTPRTDPLGCALGLRVANDSDVPAGTPTFHEHIEPILHAHCTRCHREDTAAPFELDGYEDALGWADTILEVVSDKRMPPWNASPAFGKFANDPSLSPAKIETIRKWVDADCPRGDPSKALPRQRWEDGWTIGEPDVVYQTPSYSVPAEGRLPYRYVRVRTRFDEHKWVRKAQLMSTGMESVHHVLVFVLPRRGPRAKPGAPWTPKYHVMDLFKGLPRAKRREMMLRNEPYAKDFRYAGGGVFGFFVAQLPGDEPMAFDDQRAAFLPAGATLVFQIHYTPDGTTRESVTKLGLVFADEAPEEVRHVHAMTSVTFEIPPNAPDHVERIAHRFQRGGTLLSLAPHMHLRGKSFRYVLERRDGAQEVLLDVPRFDFDWQGQYVFEQPIRFERGDRLRGIATFDNSKGNPFNPDPNATVYFGLQTDEEMLIGYFEAVWDQY